MNETGKAEWPKELPGRLVDIEELSPGVVNYVFSDLSLDEGATFNVYAFLRLVKRKVKFLIQMEKAE